MLYKSMSWKHSPSVILKTSALVVVVDSIVVVGTNDGTLLLNKLSAVKRITYDM